MAQGDAHLGTHSATQSFHDILHGRCQAQIKNQSILLLLSLITHSRAEGSLQRKLAPSQALGLMGLRRIPFSGLLCLFFSTPCSETPSPQPPQACMHMRARTRTHTHTHTHTQHPCCSLAPSSLTPCWLSGVGLVLVPAQREPRNRAVPMAQDPRTQLPIQWDPLALSSLQNLQMGVSPRPSLLPPPQRFSCPARTHTSADTCSTH